MLFLLFFMVLTYRPYAQETTRIISLVPSVTDLLYAIKAEDQLVGVSDYCTYPPAAVSKPKVGSFMTPNLEQIAALHPTIVFLYKTQTDTKDRLEQLQIPSTLLPADSLQDIYHDLNVLGKTTGKQQEAKSLTLSIQNSLQRTKAAGEKLTSSPRVLIISSRNPQKLASIYQAGPGTHLGDLLKIAGGHFAVVSRSASISLEGIISANPDIIIDCTIIDPDPKRRKEQQSDALQLWNQLDSVAAVKNKRIYFIDSPEAGIPGSQVPEIARQIYEFIK